MANPDPEYLPIFVYGTLKRGEERAGCWPRKPRHVEVATTRGRLYDVGPYPAMTVGDDKVLGELWFVEDVDLSETLRVLDQIECFGIDDIDLYVRVTVSCELVGGRAYRAYTYCYANGDDLPAAARIQPNSAGLCRWSRSP